MAIIERTPILLSLSNDFGRLSCGYFRPAVLKSFILILLTFGLASCDKGPDSPRGFSLPEGNIENGRVVFEKYQCLSCHTLEGVIPPEGLIDNPELSIMLGGKTPKITTYAELLTSIINPSHKLARGYKLDVIQEDGVSKMKNYNDVMTVTELVDLVSFLETNYELLPYQRPNYIH